MNPEPGTRPAWVDDALYPFESRFVEIDGHNLHYLDEGSGPTLLLLHGNPAWSFLYRGVISSLSDRFRCVAPDLPGFGLSEAAPGYGYLPREHSAVLEAFVDLLGLEGFAMMVQDWAGPIGLGMAGRRPELASHLIIGNTWAWPVSDDKHFTRFSRIFGGRPARLLIRRFNLFVNALVPKGHTQTSLSRQEMAHYRGPFPTPDARMPTWIFPREVVGSTAFLAEVEGNLGRLADRPALILWGEKDIAFRAKERARFERTFANHRTVRLPAAGHYLQDDAPDEVSEAIWEFLAG